jgi:glycosyltransferase involved in cell wall biosynthesis
MRLLWSGNLRPLKALPLLLHALAKIKNEVSFELQVLGEGPCGPQWESLAKRLGISASIRWRGFLPHGEAVSQYDWADVFVFTSLRDTTGMVLAEALAAGLPIVTLDHQGAADVVTSDCGIRVPVERPSATIDGLAHALKRLAGDQSLLEQLNRGALKRAQKYLWANKGREMSTIYLGAAGVAPSED